MAKSVMGLIVALVLTFATAYVGSLFPVNDWYFALTKPAWTPPNWIFAPVWTLLYLMMAVAAWWVWKVRGFSGAGFALTLFVVQLVLNAAWSWIFFGQHFIGMAAIEIVILWVLILWVTIAFYRLTPLAGALFVPYLLWVTFAAVLNFAIWRING
jgi:benzodiazapine receptor